MLIEPTVKYVNYIENSAHYLNSPKHMLNHDLDCLYRQGIVTSKDTAIKYVYDYLKEYDFTNPKEKAIDFVNWIDSISFNEFCLLNVNTYIEKLPAHIEAKNRIICEWIDKHTTYYPAAYGGGINYIPSYPHKYSR